MKTKKRIKSRIGIGSNVKINGGEHEGETGEVFKVDDGRGFLIRVEGIFSVKYGMFVWVENPDFLLELQ